jgi:zinc protease
MVARMMTEAAGLGSHDRDDLTAQLATSGVRDFKVDIGYGDESISLDGSPRELELLFQMLYLQFTAPRLDSAALAGWKNYAKYEGVSFSLFDQLAQTFARGNPRLLPVSTQLADLAKLDEAMAVYRNRFGNAGDFTFIIVGAATAQQVKPLVERYLASLPATSERETPKDLGVRPFLQRVVNTVRPYDIPKASTMLLFDGELPTAEPGAYLAEREQLATLTEVLNRRLRERLREELGGTYSVTAMDRTYPLTKEHYQLLFSFDAAPERMRAMQREMKSILDAVRDSGATEAELARTTEIQRRLLEARLQDNSYWLQRIELFNRLGLPLDRIVSPYGSEHLTPQVLQAAATRYMPQDVYIQVTAMPSDSTLYIKAAKAEKGTAKADSGKAGRGR